MHAVTALQYVPCNRKCVFNRLLLHRTSFLDNNALSAGGLALNELPSATITNSRFSNNHATVNASTATACSRSVPGAGGAVCITVQGRVVLAGTNFSQNVATNGAALHITQKCTADEDTSCGTARVSGCMFSGNTAVGGGGGVAWLYEVRTLFPASATQHAFFRMTMMNHQVGMMMQLPVLDPWHLLARVCAQLEDATFVCGNGSTLASTSAACPDWSLALQPNSTTYAPGLATSCTAITFLTPSSGKVFDYLSSSTIRSYLDTELAVKDAFNQTITGGSAEAAAQMTATLMSSGQQYIDPRAGAAASASMSGAFEAPLGAIVHIYNGVGWTGISLLPEPLRPSHTAAHDYPPTGLPAVFATAHY